MPPCWGPVNGQIMSYGVKNSIAFTYWLLVVCLDLDARIGSEIWDDHRLQSSLVRSAVLVPHIDVVVEGVQVSSRNEELVVGGVVDVELQRIRCSLGARPERLSTGGRGVLGEVVKQLLDRVVVLLLKDHASPAHAVLKGESALILEVVAEHRQRRLLIAALRQRGLQVIRLREVEVCRLSRFHKVRLEKFTCPGDRVLDLVGEASECAHRERLLRRVYRR